MVTIFMNSKNSKTSDHHRLLLNLADKVNLKRSEKTHINFKSKISATTWDEELDLSDGSNSVSDIQDYFEYIF